MYRREKNYTDETKKLVYEGFFLFVSKHSIPTIRIIF